jgi:hypothetical protein
MCQHRHQLAVAKLPKRSERLLKANCDFSPTADRPEMELTVIPKRT